MTTDKTIEEIDKARITWRKLATAQSDLLVAYRLGRRPYEKTLDAIAAAKVKLQKLGEI